MVLFCAFLTACGSYADFTLPAPRGSGNLRLTVAQLTVALLPAPTIARGTDRDVLNPSVVRQGGQYYNFYSAFDGRAWRTALATSPDGSAWSQQGIVLAPDPKTWEGDYIAANGSALFENGEWWYWYQAAQRGQPAIGLARSSDAHRWRKQPAPVMSGGPRGSWDERGVADPCVLKLDGWFYIYYLGQNRAAQQQLGLARSPDGIHWTKLRSNPVLRQPWPGTAAADVAGLGEPAVWRSKGGYSMMYTGRGAQEQRSLLAAYSGDGVHWTPEPLVITGRAAWNSQVVCDPSVLVESNRIRLWFGGGDAPRPDENLNGQIGEGEVR